MSLLSGAERKKLLSKLSEEEATSLLHDWRFWARPKQLPPEGDWAVWLLVTGRGYGKTRSAAEWVRAQAEANPDARIAVICPTAADTRDVAVEGESGLLAISPPHFRPLYESSKRRLTWPNGAQATMYSADEPERLRGPQHSHLWADELCAWRRPETWDLAMFGLRLGAKPQAVVTTTPKPLKILKELMADPRTVTVTGTTYENLENLAPLFAERIVQRYEGTRLGRQELNAEILDDNPDALWKRHNLDETRVTASPTMTRIVVGVDPQGSDGPHSAETGIVCAGRGDDGHYYVLADVSIKARPDGWGRAAVTAYHEHAADRIVGETNNGGDMVEHVIRTVEADVSFRSVHASRGKAVRAEPVAALYEQKKVHHVGFFPQLEDQLCEWIPGAKSPDRLDALVWAITELAGDQVLPKVSLGRLNEGLRRVSPNLQ